MKNRGFTFAEVLITIGVVGVVASLTIPQFVQKYIERQTVVKLKKAYTVLNNAYKMAQSEYGYDFRKDINWHNNTAPLEFINKLKPYLNIAIDCEHDYYKCYPYQKDRGNSNHYFTILEAKKGASWIGKNSSLILKDGSMITILNSPNAGQSCVSIVIDVNGPAQPNWYGHDTFFFEINADNTIQPNNAWMYSYKRATCQLNSTQQALGCAWWILTNDNMDYLHCDVSKTQTKCSR